MAYYDTIIAETSLKLYGRLGESPPTDQKGGANGTFTGGVTTGVTGIVGAGADTAVTLDGTGYATFPDAVPLDLGNGPLSLEIWVKRSATQSVSQALISKGTGAYYLRLGATNVIEFLKSQVNDIVASTATLTDTTSWHHIVVTRDPGASPVHHIYLDGTNLTLGALTTVTLSDNALALGIGIDSGGGELLPASLDEAAVYNAALSQAQVTAHYNAGISSGQVSHVTSIVANASTWTDQVGSSVSADLVTALDDSTATYIKSPGNPAGSGPITIHTGPLSKPNAGNRNFVVGLQKSANTGTMDYTVECKKSGGASVQTFNKDASAGATLVAALGNVASTGGTATCTVTNAIADGDWANGFDWVVTPLKSA